MSDYSAVAPPQNFQSSAFAAALQRAKQIAAKINPGGSSSGQKRPHEEGGGNGEPETKKLAGSGGHNDVGAGGLAQAAAQAAAVAARVAAANSAAAAAAGGAVGGGGGGGHMGGLGAGMGPPGMGGSMINEDIKVPDKMVGLIIGRGGEQITRLQSESGCKIQMAPDSNGQPDRICSLSGSREAINRAKDLIMNIVHQRGRTEGYGPMGGDMGPGNGPNGPGGPGMGPGGPMGPPGGHGPPGGPNHGGPGGMPHQIEIMVPGPKVGLIIGKGGETIKQLQEKSGAKMVVIQDGPNQEQEKPLRISGDPQKVEYAKQLVYDLIAEKEMQAYNRRGGGRNSDDGGRGPAGPGLGQGSYNDYGGSGNLGGDSVEVCVPRAAVGVVIGKGGDMIKKIQAETGARVQFQQGRDEGPGDRRCLLTGKPQHVDMARQRIEELIDSVIRRDDGPPQGGGRNNRGRNDRNNDRGGAGGGGYDRGMGHGGPRNGNNDYGGGNPNSGGGGGWGQDRNNEQQMEVTFVVPSNKCGVIIGKGGETIKQINQQSGAHCELDRRATGATAGSDKTFVIRGSPENVENCKRIVSEKVQMLLNFVCTSGSGIPQTATYPGMAPQGYTPQGWGAPAGYQQQWQHGPAAQQPDPAQTASVPGGPGGAMGPITPAQVQVNPQTGQPDYSMQWAEYYRSLGMHREAEMIEQQAKSKAAAAAAGIPSAGGAQPGMQQPGPATPAGTPAAGQAATQPSPAGAVANGAAGGSQPDYSAQWAEYYRSIGKIKEAEAIEAQMKTKGAQPGAAAQPAAGAQVLGAGAAQPGAQTAQFQPQPQAQAAYGAYQQAAGYYAAQQQPGAPQAAPQGQYNFPAYNYGQPGAQEN